MPYKRAYSGEHPKRRAQLLAYLALHPGELSCPMCGEALDVSMKLDLHHSGGIESVRRGAPGDQLAHSSCNRNTGGQKGHQASQAAKPSGSVKRRAGVPAPDGAGQ